MDLFSKSDKSRVAVSCILPIFVLFFHAVVIEGNLEPTLNRCCSLGSNWGKEELRCSSSNFTIPMVGIAAEQLGVCLSAVEICCLRTHRDRECNAGKAAARVGLDCTQSLSSGGEFYKDCCEACKLGLIAASMAMDCTFQTFQFGSPWDESYLSCCRDTAEPHQPHQSNGHVQRGPLTSPRNFNPQPNGTPLPPPAVATENLCETYPGELCADICISVPGSYVCECREGFTLMADRKTCQQEKLPNRCSITNPCSQRCLDTGVAIECSCYQGYQLGRDNRTCEDINECANEDNVCQYNNLICTNKIGSYLCTTNDGAVLEPGQVAPVGSASLPSLSSHPSRNDVEIGRCPTGYKQNFTSKLCDDIDECVLRLHKCPPDTTCKNTIGSFTCVASLEGTCAAGYKLEEISLECVDVDECVQELDNCRIKKQFCINTVGSFVCEGKLPSRQCPAGYKYSTTHQTCQDVDECELDTTCPPGETCFNTVGGYECHAIATPASTTQATQAPCPAGYKHSAGSISCIDKNECEDGSHLCDLVTEVCVNKPGGYECTKRRVTSTPQVDCQPGFTYLPAQRQCVDVDECNEDPLTCDSYQSCENTIGSYLCNCKEGFQLDSETRACVDINECQANRHDCHSSQRCDNTIGSYQCIRFTSCGTGYTLNAQTGFCEDDDECALKSDNCRALGPKFQCINTRGSFRCQRKRCEGNKYLSSSGECVTRESCSLGYESNEFGQCIDVNECSQNPCRSNERCVNKPGSFSCESNLDCGRGYEANSQGSQCVDIDECSRGSHQCTPDQQCLNRPGSYVCQCLPGYSINNAKQCIDIDECQLFRGKLQVCSSNSECQNVPGSYRCVCKEGFKHDQDDKICSDIDECATPNLCQHNCINIWGSYRCTCNSGFVLDSDSRTCRDIDECDEFKDRNLCVGICTNTPGSYECRCPSGYRMGSDVRTCIDIDECSAGNVCRRQDEICLNTRGAYFCNKIECPPNYIREQEHKNRCKRTSLFCREGDSECAQLPQTLSYNYITFVSKMTIPPVGHLDLFTMRGPYWESSACLFTLGIVSARAPQEVPKATEDNFRMRRPAKNQAIISLVKSIQGPQQVELNLTMDLYHDGIFAAKVVAKLFIVVSEYEF